VCQGNRGCSVADCGDDQVDRSAADVAGGEHPGQAGLRRQKRAAGGRRVAEGRSGPVRMNPRRSRVTWSPSHCAWGCAPMRTNRASAWTLRRAPEAVSARIREPVGLDYWIQLDIPTALQRGPAAPCPRPGHRACLISRTHSLEGMMPTRQAAAPPPEPVRVSVGYPLGGCSM
jgi:hypothetical protein